MPWRYECSSKGHPPNVGLITFLTTKKRYHLSSKTEIKQSELNLNKPFICIYSEIKRHRGRG